MFNKMPHFFIHSTGSPMISEDLRRAHVQSAGSVFLIGDATQPDSDAEDRHTSLIALNIKNFAPHVDIFVQFIRSRPIPSM